MHKTRLFGLQTFTRYYYRVGDGVTWSPEFSFRTAPAAGQQTAEVRLRHLLLNAARIGSRRTSLAGLTRLRFLRGCRSGTQPIRHLVYGDMGTFMPFGLWVTAEMAAIHSIEPYDMVIHMGDVACTQSFPEVPIGARGRAPTLRAAAVHGRREPRPPSFAHARLRAFQMAARAARPATASLRSSGTSGAAKWSRSARPCPT